MAFNPYLWTDELSQVLRECIYLSLALAVVVLAAIVAFPRCGKAQGPAKRITAAIALGWTGGIYWITREEGVWIIPSLAVLVGAVVVRQWRGADSVKGFLQLVRHGALPVALILVSFLAVLGSVAYQNWKHYGVFEINEFKSRPFQAAYGALLRIRHEWRRYYEFPKEAREKAYATSAAARELYDGLDGPSGSFWRHIGCAAEPCDDIQSGFFIWALRNAAAEKGYHASAPEAAAFYRRLAAEINAACDAGQMACTSERASLAPPFRLQYVAETLAAAPRIGGYLLAFGDGRIVSRPSVGSDGALSRFVHIAGRIATDDSANHSMRFAIARAIAHAASLAMPAATLIAACGLAIATLFANVRRRQAELLIFVLACAVAVLSRIGMVAYLEVSSFGPAVARYVSPVSPLLVVFVVLGLYLSGLVIWELRSIAPRTGTRHAP